MHDEHIVQDVQDTGLLSFYRNKMCLLVAVIQMTAFLVHLYRTATHTARDYQPNAITLYLMLTRCRPFYVFTCQCWIPFNYSSKPTKEHHLNFFKFYDGGPRSTLFTHSSLKQTHNWTCRYSFHLIACLPVSDCPPPRKPLPALLCNIHHIVGLLHLSVSPQHAHIPPHPT